MKIFNEKELNSFLEAVNCAKGNVFLKSVEGDCLNLKSTLARYVAIGELLGEHGDELELFCDDRNDEQLFFKFFKENPEVLDGVVVQR